MNSSIFFKSWIRSIIIMDFATVYCCRSNSAYHTSFTSRSNLKATITEVISAYNTSFIETYPYRDFVHDSDESELT